MQSTEIEKHEEELQALLKSSRAVLKNNAFVETARTIFDTCKDIIGATAGYVALLNKDGTENEVLFLEAGGLPCTVDPSLPMPIRGLRGESYKHQIAVYDNDFHNSKWMAFMPAGHVVVKNVMFAPLIIDGLAVGLIGLANKPDGFTDKDARLATMFGEHAAIALLNSRNLDRLEEHEKYLSSVVETANDAIITINSKGLVTSWNHTSEAMFGYTLTEMRGRSIERIIPQRFCEMHLNGLQKVSAGGKSDLIGKTFELYGLRRNGSEFPLEISLAMWRIKDDIFFTGIIRDITERKRTEEELKRHKENLESMVRVRTENLFRLNQKLNESEENLKTLNRELQNRVEKEVTANRQKDQMVYEQSRHAAIGELLVNIAHQWRQPLAAISSIAQDVKDAYDNNELNEKYLNDSVRMMMDETCYMSETIDKYRMFFKDESESRIFSLSDSIDNAISIMTPYFKSKGIEIEKALDKDCKIKGFPNEFSKIILDMMTNARDHFEECKTNQGLIKIKLFKNIGTGRINITIYNDCGGIDPKIINKIFDPYFTTKHKGRGVGLGLYMARVIIEQHMHGSIIAYNVDNGVEFLIEL